MAGQGRGKDAGCDQGRGRGRAVQHRGGHRGALVDGKDAIHIVDAGVEPRRRIVKGAWVEGIADRINAVETAFDAVAHAVAIGVAGERIAGDEDGTSPQRQRVAVDLFGIGEAVAVAVRLARIGFVAKFARVIEAIIIGVGDAGVEAIATLDAIFIFNAVGDAIVVGIRFGLIGIDELAQPVAIGVDLGTKFAPGDKPIQRGGQDIEQKRFAQIRAGR